ncbi:MAG: NAD(P)/FAD-dependent oxidoreductase [Promethearchaeota archaeon]
MVISPEIHGFLSGTLERHRVVIIGAGFVGLETVVQLRKKFSRKKMDIILVDRTENFVFKPFIHFLLRDIVKPRELRINLREFSKKWEVNFVRGEVSGIDHANKRVEFEEEGDLYYDFLVIGVGAVSAARSRPGFDQLFQLRSIDDVDILKRHLENQFKSLGGSCDGRESASICRVVVIGGGISGIEIVLELWHFVGMLCRRTGIDPGSFEFLLVEMKNSILADKNEKLARVVGKILRKKGIEVLVGHRVVNAGREFIECKVSPAGHKYYESKGVSLDENQRITINARTIVWAGGVRPNPAIEAFNVPRDSKYNLGIDVQNNLRVKNSEDVYAGGDCICWVQKQRLQPVAATAYNATRQARVIAENISRDYSEVKKLKVYRPNVHTPHLISIDGFEEGIFAVGPRILKHPRKAFGRLKQRSRRAYFSRYMPIKWQEIAQTLNPYAR